MLGRVALSRSARARVALLAAFCAAAGLAPPRAVAARVTRHEHAAARQYLRASLTYVRAISRELPAAIALTNESAEAIGRGCPGALTYVPRDEAFAEIEREIRLRVLHSAGPLLRAPTLQLVRAISPLRWADPQIAQLVRARVTEERGWALLALPGPCADIATWKQGFYASTPASTTAFDARVSAIQIDQLLRELLGPDAISREERIMRLLGPEETPAERAAAATSTRLENRFSERIAEAAAHTEAKLAAELGVSSL